jgi:hypothetical protein
MRPATLAISLLVTCLLACGGATPERESGADGAGEPGVRLSGETGSGARFGAAVGGTVELPSSFPTDVPVYPGARPTGNVAAGGRGALVTFESSDPPQKIFGFYRDGLTSLDWTIDSEVSFGGQGVLTASKDDRTASVAIVGAGSATQIVVTVSARRGGAG